MIIPELLARNARKYPGETALIESETEKEWTWRQLDDEVEGWRQVLAEAGIGKGDSVAVAAPNSPGFVLAYFAALRQGAVVVPVNIRLTAGEVRYLLEDSAAEALVFDESLGEMAEKAAAGLGVKLLTMGEVAERAAAPGADGSAGGSSVNAAAGGGGAGSAAGGGTVGAAAANHPAPAVSEDDRATILYTSGTTGRPKGAVFTHRQAIATGSMIAYEAQMYRGDRLLHLMPLSHSAPLHLFLVGGTYSAAMHVTARQFAPDLLLGLTEKYRITHFFGAPVAYLFSLRHPKFADFDLSSVKRWMYGGAPLGRDGVLAMMQGFGSDKVMCLYGLTESGPNGVPLMPEEHESKAGSVGRHSTINCELRLVDEAGNDVGPGEIGEVIMRTDSTMLEYHGKPEATAEVLRDGWIWTGDLARQDEDGYYWILDRKKDVVITGGVNVYPKEVEDVLMTHPAVADAAVVGVPHPDWGETVKVFVALRPGAGAAAGTEGNAGGSERGGASGDARADSLAGQAQLEEALLVHAREHLADYKVPRIIQFIEQVPRNASGKILKTQLRELG